MTSCKRCSYFRCENTSRTKSMFQFPANNPERLEIWVRNSGNMTITHWPPERLQHRYLCIDHFNTNYVISQPGRKRHTLLKRNAVPYPYKEDEILQDPITTPENESHSHSPLPDSTSNFSEEDASFTCKMGRQKSRNVNNSYAVSKQHYVENNCSEVVPPADTVCRVCLVNDPKLITVANELQNVYETLTKEQYYKVGYPLSMCCTCLAELQKCHTFVETALDSNKVLELRYGQQKQMNEAEPEEMYNTEIKEESIPVDNQEDPLDNIKEEFDVEPDKINCHTEFDEQTDSQINPNNSSYKDVLDSQTVPTQDCNKLNQDNDSKVEEADATSTSYDNIETERDVYKVINLLVKQCSQCKFTCVSYTDLTRHSRFHDTSRPYVCTTCQYRFEDSHHLKRHEAMHRVKYINSVKTPNVEKPLSCDFCDFKCKRQSQLKIHTRMHTGEKPFKCKICDYKATSKTFLTNHMTTHSNEKPYLCHIYSNRFAHKHSLDKHIDVHKGGRPFACAHCSYKTVRKDHLITHMWTHTQCFLK